MIEVEKFLEEAENKPVFYYVYVYYDKKLERFNQPVIAKEEPAFMRESCIGSIVKGSLKPEIAKDLLLVYIGTFDMVSGILDAFEEGKIIVDCGKIVEKQGEKIDA